MSAVLIAVVVVVVVVVASASFLLHRRRSAPSAPPQAPRSVGVPTGPPVRTAAPPETAAPEAAPPETAAPEAALPEAALPEMPAGPPEVPAAEAPAAVGVAPPGAPPRMRDRLVKARSLLSGYIGSVGKREKIDAETWSELEEALLRADVGVATTSSMLANLRARAKDARIKEPSGLAAALSEEMLSVFDGRSRDLTMATGGKTPSEEATGAAAGGPANPPTTLWLFVGVNGVGKTTTIGKLAMREIAVGHRVVMAAGDTFRAAAGEQLEKWAERTGADIVRGAEGGDPGAVVFDAVQRAVSRKADLVLADTAGRLHTKVNLMEELKKVRRVADRSPAEVTEVLLVIDATTGQNGLTQAKLFTEAVGVTGVVLTKLDGTAKGGIALAIERELGIPIKLVGLGEGPADLVPFDPGEFVDAIVAG